MSVSSNRQRQLHVIASDFIKLLFGQFHPVMQDTNNLKLVRRWQSKHNKVSRFLYTLSFGYNLSLTVLKMIGVKPVSNIKALCNAWSHWLVS